MDGGVAKSLRADRLWTALSPQSRTVAVCVAAVEKDGFDAAEEREVRKEGDCRCTDDSQKGPLEIPARARFLIGATADWILIITNCNRLRSDIFTPKTSAVSELSCVDRPTPRIRNTVDPTLQARTTRLR